MDDDIAFPMGKQKELATALVKAISEIGEVQKTAKANLGKGGSYTYATIADIIEAIKLPLARHDLAALGDCQPRPGGIEVSTIVLHSSGQMMRLAPVFVPVPRNDPQGFGSAETYARKYSMLAAFNLPTIDDDAAAAVKATVSERIQDEHRALLVRAVSEAAIEKFEAGDELGAYEEVAGITDVEEKLQLWSLLKPHSALRAAIKRIAENERKMEKLEAES